MFLVLIYGQKDPKTAQNDVKTRQKRKYNVFTRNPRPAKKMFLFCFFTKLLSFQNFRQIGQKSCFWADQNCDFGADVFFATFAQNAENALKGT